MASAIGDLVIRITSNTKQAESGMNRLIGYTDRANKTTQRYASTLRTLKTVWGQLAGMFGLGMMGYKAIASLRDSFQSLDAAAKLARPLGMTTQALLEMQYVGKITGVEITQLNKAMGKMLHNVAETADGAGEATRAFEKLRLDIERLVKLSPQEMFIEIAQAMRYLPTAAERVYVTGEIFGARYRELGNALGLTREQFEELLATYQKAHGIISEEEVDRVMAANDAWLTLGETWKGVSDQAAIAAAGPLKDLADRLTSIGVDKLSLYIQLLNAIPSLRAGARAGADPLGAIRAAGEAGIRGWGKRAEAGSPVEELKTIATHTKAFEDEIQEIYERTFEKRKRETEAYADWYEKMLKRQAAAEKAFRRTQEEEQARLENQYIEQYMRAQELFEAQEKQRKKLEEEAGPVAQPLRFAGAVEKGTAAAYSAILQGVSAMRGRGEDAAKRTAKNTEQTALTLDEILRLVRSGREDEIPLGIPGG